jgi:hypothetical protein
VQPLKGLYERRRAARAWPRRLLYVGRYVGVEGLHTLLPTREVDRLAGAMKWMHENHAHLPEMGNRAGEFASAFSADLWAQRISRMFAQIAPKQYEQARRSTMCR